MPTAILHFSSKTFKRRRLCCSEINWYVVHGCHVCSGCAAMLPILIYCLNTTAVPATTTSTTTTTIIIIIIIIAITVIIMSFVFGLMLIVLPLLQMYVYPGSLLDEDSAEKVRAFWQGGYLLHEGKAVPNSKRKKLTKVCTGMHGCFLGMPACQILLLYA